MAQLTTMTIVQQSFTCLYCIHHPTLKRSGCQQSLESIGNDAGQGLAGDQDEEDCAEDGVVLGPCWFAVCRFSGTVGLIRRIWMRRGRRPITVLFLMSCSQTSSVTKNEDKDSGGPIHVLKIQ